MTIVALPHSVVDEFHLFESECDVEFDPSRWWWRHIRGLMHFMHPTSRLPPALRAVLVDPVTCVGHPDVVVGWRIMIV